MTTTTTMRSSGKSNFARIFIIFALLSPLVFVDIAKTSFSSLLLHSNNSSLSSKRETLSVDEAAAAVTKDPSREYMRGKTQSSTTTTATTTTHEEPFYEKQTVAKVADTKQNQAAVSSGRQQQPKQWSDVKLAIFMTTHWSDSHLLYLPCWEKATRTLEIFQHADLILYTSGDPTPEQLSHFHVNNVIMKRYEESGKQDGAIRAMKDGFAENSTWFDHYDWIIRLNPDVLIRNDTWLMQAMMDPTVDALVHDCWGHTSNPRIKLHTDFYAIRPAAVNRTRVQTTEVDNAERQFTLSVSNILDAGRHQWIEGAYNPQGCRILGPVVHDHKMWQQCPDYI